MSRRNLRQMPRISYYEPEEPSLDEYVFCDVCSDFVYEYCALHGPLLVVPDDKVPSKTNLPSYVPRAAITIPHVFLHLAPSVIPGAGLGVFSTLTIPRGVRFGPYCGQRSQNVDSMYCWQIYDRNNKRSHVIDAADGNRSNWMRYVNCARHWNEQNLLAYQYKGQLYYRTIKIIPRFTELMVFYGSEFANALHINLSKYNSPPGFARKFGAPIAKKPKLDEQKEKHEVTVMSTKQKKNGQTSTKVIGKTKKLVKKSVSKIKVPITSNPITQSKVTNIIVSKENINRDKKTIPANNMCYKDDLKCKICNYVGVNSDDMKQHSLCHNNVGVIEKCRQCNVCQKTFTICDLKKHMRTHTGERPYKCDVCQSSFSVKSSLNTHMRTHTGERPYKCDICQSSFNHKVSLKSHMYTHTGERPYKCDVCQSSFNQIGSLKIHMRTHTGERPYKCDVCQSSFNQIGSLKIHMRTHTGERPYKCDICQSSFNQKGNLKTHMRTHTGERPYKCDICQSSFNQKGNLKTHMRTHTGERPYKCDICQSSFRETGNLQTHMRTHTGERPYKCDVCQSSFSEKGSLKKHMRTHTGERPYKCDICQSSYAWSDSLKNHIKIHM